MGKTNEYSKSITYFIDGTNLCYWQDTQSPSLNVLLELLILLRRDRNHSFYCIFDANTHYKLPPDQRDIYSKLLEYKEHFYQVTGGKKADDFILELANSYEAPVISNDNYNDAHYSKYRWKDRDFTPKRLFMGEVIPIRGNVHLIISDLHIHLKVTQAIQPLYKTLTSLLHVTTQRQQGKVKFYNQQEGWGLIAYETDIYFQKNAANEPIEEGQELEFVIGSNEKGLCAESITILTTAADRKFFLGTIESYDEQKTIGVIRVAGTNKSLFFYRSYVENAILQNMKGQAVEFIISTNKNGRCAKNIRLRPDLEELKTLREEVARLKRVVLDRDNTIRQLKRPTQEVSNEEKTKVADGVAHRQLVLPKDQKELDEPTQEVEAPTSQPQQATSKNQDRRDKKIPPGDKSKQPQAEKQEQKNDRSAPQKNKQELLINVKKTEQKTEQKTDQTLHPLLVEALNDGFDLPLTNGETVQTEVETGVETTPAKEETAQKTVSKANGLNKKITISRLQRERERGKQKVEETQPTNEVADEEVETAEAINETLPMSEEQNNTSAETPIETEVLPLTAMGQEQNDAVEQPSAETEVDQPKVAETTPPPTKKTKSPRGGKKTKAAPTAKEELSPVEVETNTADGTQDEAVTAETAVETQPIAEDTNTKVAAKKPRQTAKSKKAVEEAKAVLADPVALPNAEAPLVAEENSTNEVAAATETVEVEPKTTTDKPTRKGMERKQKATKQPESKADKPAPASKKTKPAAKSSETRVATAEYFDTAEKRQLWWASLSVQWKRAFNVVLKLGEVTEIPTDEDIQKLFTITRYSFNKSSDNHLTFRLSNLLGMQYLTNVTALNINEHGVTSLKGTERLKKLTSLSCAKNQLASLDGIEDLAALKELQVSKNRLADNSLQHLIDNLPQLAALDCRDNLLTDAMKETLRGLPFKDLGV